MTFFCSFRSLDLSICLLIHFRRQAIPMRVSYHNGTIIVVASFLIKTHLTPKFITTKKSKLCVDSSILLFTEATIEMFFLLFT